MSALALDQDGHLVDHLQWSPATAQQMAESLDLQLSDWHFEVLLALRNFYFEFGYAPATRPLIKYLSTMVNPEISNQLLMQKFNTGLVARQLNRLAGLPKPPNCL